MNIKDVYASAASETWEPVVDKFIEPSNGIKVQGGILVLSAINYTGGAIGEVTTRIRKAITLPGIGNYKRVNGNVSVVHHYLTGIARGPGICNAVVINLNYRAAGPRRLTRRIHSLSSGPIRIFAVRRLKNAPGTVTCNITLTQGVITRTKLIPHIPIRPSGVILTAGYNKSSTADNLTTGPAINTYSSVLVSGNKAIVLKRAARLVNARRLLNRHTGSSGIEGSVCAVIRSLRRRFVTGNVSIHKTGPAPNGVGNNLSALRRGTLKNVSGKKSKPVGRIIKCNRVPSRGNLIVVSAPKCSVRDISNVTINNTRIYVFADKHNGPINGTLVPIVGIANGPRACRSVGSGASLSASNIVSNSSAVSSLNRGLCNVLRSIYGNVPYGSRTCKFSSFTICRGRRV